jgi:hypothetical protein
MPKLLVFTPCETVIIGQNDSASLIVLLHQITFGTIPNLADPPPAGAAAQLKWNIFSQWECAENEVGQIFEHKVEMVSSANNAQIFESISDFTPEAGKPLHRMLANLVFFPLVAQGNYRLKVYLRKANQEPPAAWDLRGDHPLEVLYQR